MEISRMNFYIPSVHEKDIETVLEVSKVKLTLRATDRDNCFDLENLRNELQIRSCFSNRYRLR